MSVGALARRLLGRGFPVVGRWYRALFVDLDAVVASLPELPPGSRVLDVGAGDGELANRLLRRFPDVSATLIDLGPKVGGSLDPAHAARVTLLPGTDLAAYRARGAPPPDLVLVSDVVHHVPAAARTAFFEELRALVGSARSTLVVKEVEPGHVRATLGYLSDVYVSGDRNVRLIGREEMIELVRSVFGPVPCQETALHGLDAPNYSLVFALAPAPA